MPQYEAARKDTSPAETLIPVTALTKEMAEESARSHLTEIFNWPVGVVSQATLVAEQNEQSGAWHIIWVDGVTGEILYADQVSPTGDS